MNTEDDFKLAFDSGATGVMTDYPSKLKQYLENRPPNDIVSLLSEQEKVQNSKSCCSNSDEKSS